MEEKDLKTFAKEAKFRFKEGFWKNYNQKKQEQIIRAKEHGMSENDAVNSNAQNAQNKVRKHKLEI